MVQLLSGFQSKSLKLNRIFLADLDQFLNHSGRDIGVGTNFYGDILQIGSDRLVKLRFLLETGANLIQRGFFIAEEQIRRRIGNSSSSGIDVIPEIEHERILADGDGRMASWSLGSVIRSSASF
jgi:hypothetical protein